MNINNLLPTFLMLHLVALTLMAGTTLADYLAYSSFWKYFDQKERSIALLNVMAKFPRIIGIGAATLILTGIGMMALTHGVFGEQLWFRIKFVLVLLLILNGLAVGRRLGVKLRKIVNNDGPVFTEQVNRIKTSLKRFHLIQMGLLLLIIFLSAFKFN